MFCVLAAVAFGVVISVVVFALLKVAAAEDRAAMWDEGRKRG